MPPPVITRHDILIVTATRNVMQREQCRQRIVHALHQSFAGGAATFMDLYRRLGYPHHFHDDMDALRAEGRIVREDCEQPDGTWAKMVRVA